MTAPAAAGIKAGPEECLTPTVEIEEKPYPLWISLLALAIILTMIPVTVLFGRSISPWIVLASIIKDPAIGPDSYTGYLVSTLQGCTETTFYVLAVYFGAVQVRRVRYTLAAGLTADLAGIAASVASCVYLFG